MTIPGRTTIALAILLALALLGAAGTPAVAALWIGGNGLILASCLISGQRLTRARVVVERGAWPRLVVNGPVDVCFRCENRGSRAVRLSIVQPWPAAVQAESERINLLLAPGEEVEAAISVTPQRRGTMTILPAEVNWHYGEDLARRRVALPGCETDVSPTMHNVAQYELLRRHRALRQFGIHRLRMVGAGREFDQLREYGPDDDYRDIDWKATARRRSPVTAVYQAERSQDVMLCVETGRMMGNPFGHATALDHAVDAALVLAHVCCQSGDRCGLAVFRDTVTQYMKPANGQVATQRILKSLTHIRSQALFPSYAALAEALRMHQKRRSLTLLFTDLNDPQLAANLLSVAPSVSRRHLFVVVSLRDPMLESIACSAPTDRMGLHQVLAARRLSDERAARIRDLTRAGMRVLEVDADSITVDVINTYLEIKTRQLI
jgi:uncharacterized protein (DUF58 family)